MDNAKALVKHSSWYEGEVRQTVRSLCNYYDIEPWACQPRRPKQKNRVEAGVGLAQRRILAAMELECTPMARDLDHLNEQVKAKLEELNNATLTATERSNTRRQMFEDKEREFLGRLPLQAFCPLWISASLSLIVAIAFAYQATVIATALAGVHRQARFGDDYR